MRKHRYREGGRESCRGRVLGKEPTVGTLRIDREKLQLCGGEMGILPG